MMYGLQSTKMVSNLRNAHLRTVNENPSVQYAQDKTEMTKRVRYLQSLQGDSFKKMFQSDYPADHSAKILGKTQAYRNASTAEMVDVPIGKGDLRESKSLKQRESLVNFDQQPGEQSRLE